MTKRLFLITLMILPAIPIPCWAVDMNSCVFNNHAKSIAFIEYSYKDDKGGHDTIKGSGFVISTDGHIVTASHVLRPSDQAKVTDESVAVHLESSTYPAISAQIVRRDNDLDVALLKIPTHPGQPWSALPVGDSSAIHVGSPVTGLGYPSGSDLSIIPTSLVTSPNTIIDGVAKPWWQTGLSLNPGDSGGPIFGPLGTVIGVAVAGRVGASLITYVIPLQYAHSLLEDAAVKMAAAGPCADAPVCRDVSHGLEKYAIDEPVGRWSDWRGGGYNRNAYCNDLLGALKSEYPDAEFTKTRDDEESRDKGFRQFEYRYFCEFRRQEQPIYREAKGVECLEKTSSP
jgi:hypothetical protein